MRSPLDEVSDDVIRRVVAEGWALAVERVRYFPEGGGAYHWIATGDDGGRWFVTCDDLDTKPWLGTDRSTVFDNLRLAYGTAAALAQIGCAFVVAPIAASDGARAVRFDDRLCASVFDHVDGRAGRWGEQMGVPGVAELVTMLAELHGAAPPSSGLGHRGVDVPGRAAFEGILGELDRRWDGGPLSDLARQTLDRHADVVAAWFDDLDRAIVGSADVSGVAVVTHGEPHPGNLLSTASGWRLVDWDTVALSPPERDMWMLHEADGRAGELYRRLTGTALDPEALAAYRLSWALTDLVAFSVQLHDEHRGHADDRHALDAIRRILAGDEPRPYSTRAG